MNVSWSEDAWDDYTKHWGHASNKKIKLKIEKMIQEITRDPKTSAYMAEKLKYDLSGWSSMRIDGTDRLVYQVVGDTLRILSCRYHYD